MREASANSRRARSSVCSGSTQFSAMSPVWVANAIRRLSAFDAIQLTMRAYTSG